MSDMEDEVENGEDEEENGGTSLTKKVAMGAVAGLATTAVAAGARKLMGDSGDDGDDQGDDDGGDDGGDEGDESDGPMSRAGDR